MTNLKDIASKMTEKGKGILAADESTPTCSKRFDSIAIESTFESRNEYRDLLITAEGMEKYIGGVIMFDETLRQSTTCDSQIDAWIKEATAATGDKRRKTWQKAQKKTSPRNNSRCTNVSYGWIFPCKS